MMNAGMGRGGQKSVGCNITTHLRLRVEPPQKGRKRDSKKGGGAVMSGGALVFRACTYVS
jgi:hypothetical protein